MAERKRFTQVKGTSSRQLTQLQQEHEGGEQIGGPGAAGCSKIVEVQQCLGDVMDTFAVELFVVFLVVLYIILFAVETSLAPATRDEYRVRGVHPKP